jgi:hypothetical protein
MASRADKILGILIAPVVVAGLVLCIPLFMLMHLGQLLRHVWLVLRLRMSWPAHKFALVAYSDSPVWGPVFEDHVLPVIAEHCVVVNRSRENRKRQFHLERAALEFWGGHRSYNPLAIVLRGYGRVRVFRFFEEFEELKHGRPAPLEAKISEFLQYVERPPHTDA